MQRAPPSVTSRAVWYCPDPPQVKLGTGLGQQHLSGVHTSPSSCRLMKDVWRYIYLYDILHLKGNNAKRPHQFIESIDE
ncbi:hypothetical protein TRIUR3_12528 [Triticum urartu]|uniref:Uncharacterized protein n=1 Tax=Triticum urartu TaxID=4572 RepID=M7ZQ55_TRIUA|nr:hypothetical protein TRIUR3_12528 [Triticum urartu]